MQKTVRLGRAAMLRSQHILEHFIYCACHETRRRRERNIMCERRSALFGKPISESSRLMPGSIMSSSPISSCASVCCVTYGYATESRLVL